MKRMNADDVLAVEQLGYFYEQAYGCGGHLDDIPALYSVSDDCEIHTNANLSGIESIRAQYVEYYDGTPLYDTYHCGQQICTPVIEVDGDTASGRFPTSSFFIQCCAGSPVRKPIPDPPYKVQSTFEIWFHDFVKENSLWKIKYFHFTGLVSFGMQEPFWRWDPNDGGLASRSLLHTLTTPFPIMDYKFDYAKEEVKRHASK